MSSTATPAAPGHAFIPGSAKMFWLVVLLGALSALGPFSIDTYLPAFPSIAETYHATVGAVEVTLAVYFVGLSLGQLLYGPFTDAYGRKRPLYVGLTLYVLASAGCAFAPTIGVLTALRFLQALGGCSAMLIARTVVRDYFPPREAARVFSFLMLVIGVSPLIAPLVGGYLVVHGSWRTTFWLVSTMGTLCLLSVIMFLKESHPPECRQPVSLSGTFRLYKLLLTDRHFLVYAIAGSLMSTGMFAYLEGSPFVFIQLFHIPADHFGYYFGSVTLCMVLGAQINGFLVKNLEPARIFPVVLMVAAVAGSILLLNAATGFGGFFGILIPLGCFVCCNGLSGPNATALALGPHGRVAGNAAAVLGCIQFGLGGLGGGLVSLFDNGTAMPMAVTICAAGLLGLTIQLLFARKPVHSSGA